VITHLDDYRPTAEIPAPWLQPAPVTYVRRSIRRRITTSQFARDIRNHGALVGLALATVGCGLHSLVGAL
jgi:hypothetical protein